MSEENKDIKVNGSEVEEKTSYTSEEVKSMIEAATKSMVTKEHMNKIVETRIADIKVKAEQEAKQREELAKLEGDEKIKKEFEIKEKALKEENFLLKKEKKERELTESKMNLAISKGYSTDILEVVDASSIEEFEARLEKFSNLLDARTQEKVNERFKGQTPKTGQTKTDAVTLDMFKKYKYNQRMALKKSNPELFKTLNSQL